MILCRVGGYSDSAVSGRKLCFFLTMAEFPRHGGHVSYQNNDKFFASYELAGCSINFYVPNI